MICQIISGKIQDIRLVYLKTCDQYIKRLQPSITENSKKVSKIRRWVEKKINRPGNCDRRMNFG